MGERNWIKVKLRQLLGFHGNQKMEQMLNCVMEKEEEDLVMRIVSASSLSSLSPTIKKRKFSPDKDDLERCLDKLERDVDDLASMMELEEMAGKKEKVEKVWRKLQD